MLFSSPVFLFGYLVGVLVIYYGLLRFLDIRIRNSFLLAVSILFYAWGEPKYVFLLLLSIVANWAFGLWVDFCRRKKKNKSCRMVLALMLLFNVSLLGAFKYLGFFIRNVNTLTGLNIPLPQLLLPIGISFFTFQAISYVADVYRGIREAEKNILNIALYLSFFPYLLAGPIVRYQTIAEQIKSRRENINDFSVGACRFLVGLSKKILISNQVAAIADNAFGSGVTSVGFAWLGVVAYALQIYYDFSGYSDMAIGLGRMFGFSFEENFNYPYISKSITEFWGRWHISLGTWFRDYVYIPLGTSRVKSGIRLIFNLLTVWALIGLWHGASWNFILWGLYFFVLLAMEKFCFGSWLKNPDALSVPQKLISYGYAALAVLLGWVLFRAENLSAAASYLGVMFGFGAEGFAETRLWQYLAEKKVYLLLGILFSTPVMPYLYGKVQKHMEKPVLRAAACIVYPSAMILMFLICVSYLLKGSYHSFLYI